MDNSKAKILSAAVSLAKRRGLRKLTRLTVSTASGVATGTVNYHFGTVQKLRDAVVKVAIEKNIYEIVSEAIIAKHPLATKLPKVVRRTALACAA